MTGRNWITPGSKGLNVCWSPPGRRPPEHLVEQIVEELIEKYGGRVEHSHIVEEDVHFNLPRSLRVLQRDRTESIANSAPSIPLVQINHS